MVWHDPKLGGFHSFGPQLDGFHGKSMENPWKIFMENPSIKWMRTGAKKTDTSQSSGEK